MHAAVRIDLHNSLSHKEDRLTVEDQMGGAHKLSGHPPHTHQ